MHGGWVAKATTGSVARQPAVLCSVMNTLMMSLMLGSPGCKVFPVWSWPGAQSLCMASWPHPRTSSLPRIWVGTTVIPYFTHHKDHSHSQRGSASLKTWQRVLWLT